MKNLYLLRHGRQNDKRCNVNVPLSKEGHRQAELTGNRMKEYGIEKIYSSHLIRAVETAQDINQILQVPFEELDGIEEIDFGELTGHTSEYIECEFAEFQKEKGKMLEDLPYPGGECGEDVVRRAYPAILECLEREEQNIAMVTHGGVIRSLCAQILGLEQKDKLLFAKDLENCSITHFRYDDNMKRFYLERLNDYAHIEPYEELLRKKWTE